MLIGNCRFDVVRIGEDPLPAWFMAVEDIFSRAECQASKLCGSDLIYGARYLCRFTAT